MTTATLPRPLSEVAQRAAVIHAELKAAGIKAQVTSKSYSMGCSIDVAVLAGNLAVATKIAQKQQSVDRDDATGEILSGGNRFVFVELDWTRVKVKAAELLPAVQAAWTVAVANPGRIEPVVGTVFAVAKDSHDGSVWGPANSERGCRGRVYDADAAAQRIARLVLAEG